MRCAIIMNNRCGSSWMMHMLRSLGLKAGEFVSIETPEKWEADLNSLEAVHSTIVMKLNTTTLRKAIDIFGVDVMRRWRFVRMMRLDKFAQAASNYLARETDQWHTVDDGENPINPPEVVWDREEFLKVYRRVCTSEARMPAQIRRLGVLVPVITYEDLCVMPEELAEQVYYHFTGEVPRNKPDAGGMIKNENSRLVEHWRMLFAQHELQEALCDQRGTK